MAGTNSYLSSGIGAPNLPTEGLEALGGMYAVRNQGIAEEVHRRQMAIADLERARQAQEYAEFMYGAPNRQLKSDTDLMSSVGARNRENLIQARKTSDTEFENSPDMIRATRQLQSNDLFGKLSAQQRSEALNKMQLIATMMGPFVEEYEGAMNSGDPAKAAGLRDQYAYTLDQLKEAGVNVDKFSQMNMEQAMPNIKAAIKSSVMTIPVLQKLVEADFERGTKLSNTAMEGNYSLERQKLANTGAKAVAEARQDGKDDDYLQPNKVIGRVLKKLQQNESVDPTEVGIARDFIEQQWEKNVGQQLYMRLLTRGLTPQQAAQEYDNEKTKQLRRNYPKLYNEGSANNEDTIRNQLKSRNVPYEPNKYNYEMLPDGNIRRTPK